MKAGPALRVAAVATLLIAGVYAIAACAVFALSSARLTSQADARLSQMLASARSHPLDVIRDSHAGQDSDGDGDRDDDTDDSPAYLWVVAGSGDSRVVSARSAGAPALPAGVLRTLPDPGRAVTADLGHGKSYRLLTTRTAAGQVVAGISQAGNVHTLHLLRDGEFVVGPVLLLAMFGGSLIVGLRALAPVEEARRRQLEFTADASHELRTPLSVLRAEVDVALSTRRAAAAYRDSLIRVRSEGERLSRLVDDLLWLARFDSQPPPPGDEPIDVATLAASCADRFRAVGPAVTADTGGGPALINAPPEWIDRLMGVLMDNACRYAGPDGQVRISVRTTGGRLALAVEDSGPGIAEEQRPQLFDRFQRAEHSGSGAGLGLAIGDSIVRSTGGRWRVGTSPLGGAVLEVSWKHQHKLPG
ncbi:MAG TPA: HAMP domain-containing sensor histidine kinase [Trebonia sp.]|nr:HAMP domain-containing sensor histidine kinase [Trebonia sp.]